MDRPLRHNFNYTNHPRFVVLGLGGTFQIPTQQGAMEGLSCVWRFSDNGAWNNGPIRNHRQGDVIYAYPVESLIARSNPDQVELHNPWVLVGTPAWQPARNTRQVPVPPPADDPWAQDDEDDVEDDTLTEHEMVAALMPGDAHPTMDGITLTLSEINAARAILGHLPHSPFATINDLSQETRNRMAAAQVASTQESTNEVTTFTPPSGSAKLWCLTFNGAPVASFEEFCAVATPLTEEVREGRMSAATVMWAGQWQADPEGMLDRMMEMEPVLVACVGYTPVAQPSGAPATIVTTALELQEQPVGALIVRAAAGALLSGGMSNHFSFNETGGLVINPENPPSLEQGYSMMGRVFSTEETAERLKNFSRWTQGALIAEMQRFFGDTFEMDALCASTERTYNTLNACLNTHLRWAHRKRESLSWTHHKEVEFSTLDEPNKEWVLDRAVQYSLSVAEMRNLKGFVITYGREGLEADMPEDRTALLDRLTVRAANRNYMFLLQGAWYSYRGPFEHIPNGASQILNADTRQVLDREGVATAPREWVPVGVEVPYLRGHAATNAEGVQEAREGAPDAPVRRSRGGRTQHAGVTAGEVVTPVAIYPDLERANQIIAETADYHFVHAAANFQDAMNDHLRNHPEVPYLHEITEQAGPIVEVALTQPEDALNYEFMSRNFAYEDGARRLLAMTGYPRNMPENLRVMLDQARMANEIDIANPAQPHTLPEFLQEYIQAADDYLFPF